MVFGYEVNSLTTSGPNVAMFVYLENTYFFGWDVDKNYVAASSMARHWGFDTRAEDAAMDSFAARVRFRLRRGDDAKAVVREFMASHLLVGDASRSRY